MQIVTKANLSDFTQKLLENDKAIKNSLEEKISNIPMYDDSELTEKINSLIDTEEKTGAFNVDTSLTQGYVNNMGDINSSNAQYSCTKKIRVKTGDVIFVSSTNVAGDFDYEKMPMRFGCAYNGVNVVSDKGWTSAVNEYTVPDGVTHVIVSFDVQNYANHVVKKYTTAEVGKLKDSANSASVEKVLSEQNLVRSKVIGSDFLSSTSDTLLDGNGIFLEENSIAKNKVLSFFCSISSIGSGVLRLGHGKTTYNASYVEIDATNVSIYKYSWQKELQKQQAHGLTLSDYIMVSIKVGSDNKEKMTIMTSTGMFTLDGIYWTGRSGQIFAEVEGFSVTDATLNWYCDDYKKSIYAYGDSYFETTGTVRWTAYLLANGYDNLLMDSFGGRFSDKAYESFVNSLKHGTPKYALWCMGQNDPDSTTSGINTKWKTATDNFIKKCKEKGIIPILATIPNVRGGAVGDTNIDTERTHDYKNDYVKNSGYRYIDFAKAVGAYTSNNWYSGMLSSDGVHPDELGAKALYMQAIVDFPELMYNN